MSHSIEIFVAYPGPLEGFSQELENVLEIKLVRSTVTPDDAFKGMHEWEDMGVFLLVFKEHGFENDRDMVFEDYSHNLSIRGTRNKAELREKSLYTFAYFAFNRLKDLNKYKLMMTDDLQKKLAEFDPKEAE